MKNEELCNLGVGCEDVGICYARHMGLPERCGRTQPLDQKQELRTTKLDSTGAAAVDQNYFWQPISTCPIGVKVQLLGKGGVAFYGQYNYRDGFYTHWAPLPKLPKEST